MAKIKTGIHKAKQFFHKNGKKMYLNGLTGLTAMSLMTVTASAEGETTGSITSGINTVVSLFGQLWSLITSNELLLTYAAIGLVGAAFGLVKKAKKSVR